MERAQATRYFREPQPPLETARETIFTLLDELLDLYGSRIRIWSHSFIYEVSDRNDKRGKPIWKEGENVKMHRWSRTLKLAKNAASVTLEQWYDSPETQAKEHGYRVRLLGVSGHVIFRGTTPLHKPRRRT